MSAAHLRARPLSAVPLTARTGLVVAAALLMASACLGLSITTAWVVPRIVTLAISLVVAVAMVAMLVRDVRTWKRMPVLGVTNLLFETALTDALSQMLDGMRSEDADAEVSRDANGLAFTHHLPSVCKGEPCPFHAPSDHHMKAWPLIFDRGRPPLIGRKCEHGVGHPDPDSLTYLFECERIEAQQAGTVVDPLRIEFWARHDACDGCCHPSASLPGLVSDAVLTPRPALDDPEIDQDRTVAAFELAADFWPEGYPEAADERPDVWAQVVPPAPVLDDIKPVAPLVGCHHCGVPVIHDADGMLIHDTDPPVQACRSVPGGMRIMNAPITIATLPPSERQNP